MLQTVFHLAVIAVTVSQAKQAAKEKKNGAVSASADRDAFDCPMRQFLLEYAVEVQPNITSDKLQEIADALNGDPSKASNCTVTVDSIKTQHPKRRAPSWDDLEDHYTKIPNNHNNNQQHEVVTYFVSNELGDDSNDGSFERPFHSLEVAIEKAKSHDRDVFKRVILRQGTYYVTKTIEFRAKHSNFLISNFNNEKVEISAATPIQCTWQLYKTGSNGKDIYQCTVPSSAGITDIKGLRINGTRAIRARYPNANPETEGFGSTLTADSWNAPTIPTLPDVWYYPSEPQRNTSTSDWFYYYNLGIGGVCEHFDPNAAYWCSPSPQGGGAVTYTIPSGMRFSTSVLPNSPYLDASQAVIQAWRPSHWASWMFEVGTYNKLNSTFGEFIFSKGGFQGARGNKEGEDFYIENVIEELDYPTEWFYNTSTSTLYYYNNDTGAPSNIEFEATNLKVLVSYIGNMTDPVSNHTIRGVTLKDTVYTYMDAHGIPSGGDWALQRTGAVYLDGVSNIVIDSNLFTRLDGNAISINRYARNVSITNNEFVWIGDSAITQWGDTEGVSFPNANDTNNGIPATTMGYDGTSGNQPRGTYIAYNFVHELGIWEKQSSFYFQAKSCQNTIKNNIFFNGPRAGINFNDGFGGGSLIDRNILFNTCRESGDHGPFNSWDRQVYITKVNDGVTTSVVKAYDELSRNFMISNYNGQEGVDNDDGSCYYKTHDNFICYSGNGMKNDFGGHDNHHYNNVYAYLTAPSCYSISASTGQLAGHNDYFYNNTCIIDGTVTKLTNYASFDCDTDSSQWPVTSYNKVYINNGSDSNVGLCDKSESTVQSSENYDLGTEIYGTYPSPSDIIAQAKQILYN